MVEELKNLVKDFESEEQAIWGTYRYDADAIPEEDWERIMLYRELKEVCIRRSMEQ